MENGLENRISQFVEKYKDKKIAVVGLGVEGLSTIAFLKKHNLSVTVFDELLTDGDATVQELRQKNIDVILGKHVFDQLQNFDVVYRSPGISFLRPEIQKAKENGTEITSHIKLFLDLCPSSIIGATGTKGKGTTTSLIAEMLTKQGFTVFVGGNIGRPPLDFLNQLDVHSKVVLELSSFQLMDVTKSPHIAVVLMITEEHLNYHTDVYEYVDAKRNILRFQSKADYAIINRDYLASSESDIHTDAQLFRVSVERSCEGCYVKDKKIYVSGFGIEKEIIDTKQILIPGKHNWENVCAAIMAATLAGVSNENIVSVLKTFKGLEHRLQLIRKVNGVKYYDDSFSTTPETAVAAIQSFEQPEILILGGSSKNSDFTELGRVIRFAKNIKAIIGIGLEWERIKEQINLEQRSESLDDILLIEGATSMQQIVLAASKIAQPGDVVLLTPACASFDMFKNYKDRGELFVKEVNKL